jgi:hypothetical protein
MCADWRVPAEFLERGDDTNGFDDISEGGKLLPKPARSLVTAWFGDKRLVAVVQELREHGYYQRDHRLTFLGGETLRAAAAQIEILDGAHQDAMSE